jgi:hypothetical protein
MTTEDLINGLKHTADDHPCCRETIEATIQKIEELENTPKSIREYLATPVTKHALRMLGEKYRELERENARLREAIKYEPLASALVKTGIVQEDAIECPCAYDEYKTQDAIHAMADILSNITITDPDKPTE